MTDKTDALKTLHKTLVDSQKGYADFAERAENAEVKSTLEGLRADRAQFAADLRTLGMKDGIEFPDDGSMLASAHRTFAEVKSSVMGSTDKSLFEECVRGERHLLGKYDEAIEASGADGDWTVLRQQRETVAADVTRLEADAQAAA